MGSSRFGTSEMDHPKGPDSDDQLDASCGRRNEQTCEDIREMAAWRNKNKLRRRLSLSLSRNGKTCFLLTAVRFNTLRLCGCQGRAEILALSKDDCRLTRLLQTVDDILTGTDLREKAIQSTQIMSL